MTVTRITPPKGFEPGDVAVVRRLNLEVIVDITGYDYSGPIYSVRWLDAGNNINQAFFRPAELRAK